MAKFEIANSYYTEINESWGSTMILHCIDNDEYEMDTGAGILCTQDAGGDGNLTEELEKLGFDIKKDFDFNPITIDEINELSGCGYEFIEWANLQNGEEAMKPFEEVKKELELSEIPSDDKKYLILTKDQYIEDESVREFADSIEEAYEKAKGWIGKAYISIVVINEKDQKDDLEGELESIILGKKYVE